MITPDPTLHANVLERIAEVALLISLFSVGLKMGGVPLFDRRWILPLRLALVSITITVGLITVVGVWGLGLSLGAAVLLGLGLMGQHELGTGGWSWWAVDVFWAMGGGLLIGAASGALIGKLVVHLRTRHHHALGLENSCRSVWWR